MKLQRGFTLVELMVTVAVVAILATVAAPNFSALIEDQRVTSQINDLVGSLQLARSEAVKRGANITFAPVGGSYGGGWCIFIGATCSGNNILRQHEAAAALTAGPSAALVFNSQGQVSSTSLTPFAFTLTPAGCATGDKRRRILTVSQTGRATMQVTTCS